MSRQSLLYLVHRVPFPPDKGDKIRSYHLLRDLVERFDVHLGCFVDDPRDMDYVDDLARMCASVHVRPLSPKMARLRSLRGLLTGRPLSVPYYRDAAMQSWVDETLAAQAIESAVVFSSPMAQYLLGEKYDGMRRVMDFVDIDSDKWRQYADRKRGPMAWLYAREAAKLETFERRVASAFDASVFVSDNETEMFSKISPATSDKHHAVANGVDIDFFDPALEFEDPYPANSTPIAFTGMMDYWPNVDAVAWFASEVYPRVRERVADAEFWIVGGSPSPAVRALEQLDGVHVTGRVPDIRPWIAHARAIAAPLRVARGVQNKVLEALAMSKAVVCTPQAAAGLSNVAEAPIDVASDEDALAEAVCRALSSDARNAGGREYVLRHYDWAKNLSRLGELLDRPSPLADAESA